MQARGPENTGEIGDLNAIWIGDHDLADPEVGQIGDDPRTNTPNSDDTDLGTAEQRLPGFAQEPNLPIIDRVSVDGSLPWRGVQPVNRASHHTGLSKWEPTPASDPEFARDCPLGEDQSSDRRSVHDIQKRRVSSLVRREIGVAKRHGIGSSVVMDGQVRQPLVAALTSAIRDEPGGEHAVAGPSRHIVDAISCDEQFPGKKTEATGGVHDACRQDGTVFVPIGEEVPEEIATEPFGKG